MELTSQTSLERTFTTVGHLEPDRVPVFLGLTMHGAREYGVSIEDYFATPLRVAEAQLRMRERIGHDNLMGFLHAAGEMEAWGSSVLYFEDGPPNAGSPVIMDPNEILDLEPPPLSHSPSMQNTLEVLSILKGEVADQVPIVGVVIAPFSLPVMQMGFGPYLDLLFESPALFRRLMRTNEEFTVAWANAQIEAGASVIVYFDPVSSPTVIPSEVYLQTGYQVALHTLPRIEGPTVTHFASGRTLTIVEDVARTGTAAIGISSDDDLEALKLRCAGKLCILGNLNGIAMRDWTPDQTEKEVKAVIERAGRGGGLILSDTHGEIPIQVGEEVLQALVSAAREWGRYPLDWIPGHA